VTRSSTSSTRRSDTTHSSRFVRQNSTSLGTGLAAVRNCSTEFVLLFCETEPCSSTHGSPALSIATHSPRDPFGRTSRAYSLGRCRQRRLCRFRRTTRLFAPDELLDRLIVPDEICKRLFLTLMSTTSVPLRRSHQTVGGESGTHRRGNPRSNFRAVITDWNNSATSWTDWFSRKARPAQDPSQARGSVYKPAFITRYIIEQTLGGVLADRLRRCGKSTRRKRRGNSQDQLRRSARL